MAAKTAIRAAYLLSASVYWNRFETQSKLMWRCHIRRRYQAKSGAVGGKIR
jgi:hypothetical protein